MECLESSRGVRPGKHTMRSAEAKDRHARKKCRRTDGGVPSSLLLLVSPRRATSRRRDACPNYNTKRTRRSYPCICCRRNINQGLTAIDLPHARKDKQACCFGSKSAASTSEEINRFGCFITSSPHARCTGITGTDHHDAAAGAPGFVGGGSGLIGRRICRPCGAWGGSGTCVVAGRRVMGLLLYGQRTGLDTPLCYLACFP